MRVDSSSRADLRRLFMEHPGAQDAGDRGATGFCLVAGCSAMATLTPEGALSCERGHPHEQVECALRDW
jgi:hypothetical protein